MVCDLLTTWVSVLSQTIDFTKQYDDICTYTYIYIYIYTPRSIQTWRIARLRGLTFPSILFCLCALRAMALKNIFNCIAQCAADLAAHMTLALRKLRELRSQALFGNEFMRFMYRSKLISGP